MFTPNLSKILVKENSAAINLFRTLPVNWGSLTPAKVEDVTDLIHDYIAEAVDTTVKLTKEGSYIVNTNKGIGDFTRYEFKDIREMLEHKDIKGDVKEILERNRTFIIANELERVEAYKELGGSISGLGPIARKKLEKGEGLTEIEGFLKRQSTIDLSTQLHSNLAKYIKPADVSGVIYEKMVIMKPTLKPGTEQIVIDKRLGTKPIETTIGQIVNTPPNKIDRGEELSPEEAEAQYPSIGMKKMEEYGKEKAERDIKLRKRLERKQREDEINARVFKQMEEEKAIEKAKAEEIAKQKEERLQEEAREKAMNDLRKREEDLRKQEALEAKGKTKEKKEFDVDRDKRTEQIGNFKSLLADYDSSVDKFITESNGKQKINTDAFFTTERVGKEIITKTISKFVEDYLYKWRDNPTEHSISDLTKYLKNTVKPAIATKSQAREIGYFIDDINTNLGKRFK